MTTPSVHDHQSPFERAIYANLQRAEVEAGMKEYPNTGITFAEYAEAAAANAIYPGEDTFWGLQYVTAGLANESGEVLGVIKKMQRDGGYKPNDEIIMAHDRDRLIAELGDCAWYLAMACREAGVDPNEVLHHNLAKLADRKARDVLSGSGDSR